MGMELSNIGNLTVENNVVDSLSTITTEALRVEHCTDVHAFNNRRINGDLARAGRSYQISLAALLFWLPTTGAETVTIPAGAETRENDRNTAVPFSAAGNVSSQQIYSPSLFPVISAPGEFFQLDGIGFRLSSRGTVGFGSQATFDRVEIVLSTGNGPFTTSFEQNHGDNILIVYDQALTLRGTVPPGTTPSSFDLQIPFTNPFLYNPSEGALVVEIRKYGGGEVLSTLAGAEVSGVTYYTKTIFGVGTANNFGMETQISYQVVPEPSSLAFFVGGLVIFGAATLKRR